MSINKEMSDKLHIASEYMDAELITEIQQFEDYSFRTKPIVTILCSENRLRMNVNNLVTDINDVDFYVCGTYNDEDLAEAMNKALYSDAVIANTTALKLAPKGLYDVLESISKVDKEVYLILSGWASLPKTKELSESKIKKVLEEFPFAKINVCKNVYDKPLEGFYSTDELLSNYVAKILSNYEHTHKTQENALYKKLYKKIRSFCGLLADNIRSETILFDNLQAVMEFKKRRYEITFSNNTVNVSEASSIIESNINQLSKDEIIYGIEKEMGISAQNAIKDDPVTAQNIAKKYVADTIISTIDDYINHDNSSITNKADAKISALADDLSSVLSKINKCKFIDLSKREELLELIGKTEKLNENADYIGCSFSEVLEKIKRVIEPKILSFDFKGDHKKFISKALSVLLTNVDDIINCSANRCNEYSDIDEYNSECPKDSTENSLFSDRASLVGSTLSEELRATVEENEEDTAWNTFNNETGRLISESKALLSSMLYDYTQTKNVEISEQNRIAVSEYFEKIIGQLKVISSDYRDLIKRIEDSFI